MKKYRFLPALLTVVLLLLLLTACQTVPITQVEPASSTPSSSSITPPSSSAVPPTSSVPVTTPPSLAGSNGIAFIFESYGNYVLPGWYPQKAERGCLYWVEKETKEYFMLCEDPVIYCLTTDTHVYYVKEAEPTKVYATPISDFTNHQLQSETPLPVIEDGLAFRYYGPQNIYLSPDWRYYEGIVDHLYWVVKATKEVYVVCDEPVVNHVSTDTHVYFVKASEPTKIYRTPVGNFSEHELVYTSTHGNVSDMTIDTYTIQKDLILQFVADNKKFMILDLNTGEDHFIMEQYYIRSALFEDGCTDTWEEQRELVFYGMPTEEAKDTGYFYDLDTGEIEEIHECED